MQVGKVIIKRKSQIIGAFWPIEVFRKGKIGSLKPGQALEIESDADFTINISYDPPFMGIYSVEKKIKQGDNLHLEVSFSFGDLRLKELPKR